MKGNITITAPWGCKHGKTVDYVQIEFIDELSHAHFLRVDMSYRDFARALAGHGEMPCEFELRADKVGLVREHEQRDVFLPDGECDTRRMRALEAVRSLELDGWVGRVDDALNHHRLVKRGDKGAWYAVLFTRYV